MKSMLRRLFVGAITLLVVIAGFSSAASAGSGQAGTFTVYGLPTAQAGPSEIVAAADGAMWFTEFNAGAIGRITATGLITEYPIPTASSAPDGLIPGRDGSIWFAETRGNKIGRITLDGQITEFAVPTASTNPTSVAAGSDGNIWFTERRTASSTGAVARLIPATGAVTEFPVTAGGHPLVITAGPDGNLWFTEVPGNHIGRITPDGVITEFPIPTPASRPNNIRPGPHDALYFVETVGKIARVTLDGTIKEYDLPNPSDQPVGVGAGPDGNDVWFTGSADITIGRLTVDCRSANDDPSTCH